MKGGGGVPGRHSMLEGGGVQGEKYFIWSKRGGPDSLNTPPLLGPLLK